MKNFRETESPEKIPIIQHPGCSIVIPTANRPTLLPRALASVLAQTYTTYEAIIVDDGADTSEVQHIVESFNDARLRYVRNAGSHGGGAARNYGAARARADLIAFLDDDDEWMPDKLAIQIARIHSASDDAAFCITAVVNRHDDHEERTHVEAGERDFSELSLTRFKGFLTSTLLVRRNAFQAVGGFDEAFPSHQEAELLIRLAHAYRGIGIDEPLVRMDVSTTHEHIGGDLPRRIRGREMLLEKHAARYVGKPALLALQRYRLGLWYLKAGRRRDARASFKTAFQLHALPRYLLRYILSSFPYERS